MIKNLFTLALVLAVGAAIGIVQMKAEHSMTNQSGDRTPAGCPKDSIYCSSGDQTNQTTLYPNKIVVKSPNGDGTIMLDDVKSVVRKNLTVRIYSVDQSHVELRFRLLLDAKQFEELIKKQL